MPTVYIETSIVSYLRTRPSSQVIAAARQLMTRRWWDDERQNYELVTSQFVLDEAAKGDTELATNRLESLADIPLLELPDEVATLAHELVSNAILPRKALLDALHICIASFHGIEFLLTWNCTHIANARLLPRVRRFLAQRGHGMSEVCTPEELLDEVNPID